MGCSIKCDYGYNRCCIDCDERPTCGAVCEKLDKCEFTCNCPEWIPDDVKITSKGEKLRRFLYKIGWVPRKYYECLQKEYNDLNDELMKSVIDAIDAKNKVREHEKLMIGMVQQCAITKDKYENRYVSVTHKTLEETSNFKLSIKDIGGQKYPFYVIKAEKEQICTAAEKEE